MYHQISPFYQESCDSCRFLHSRFDRVLNLSRKSLCDSTLNTPEIQRILHRCSCSSKNSSITILDLSENRLTYLNLEFLSTTTTHFSLLLTTVTKLDVSRNEINCLPSNLHLLPNLSHLNLYRNNIQDLPANFAQLQNLTWINVNRNPINSISAEFRQVAGPMSTQFECHQAAIAIKEWIRSRNAYSAQDKSSKRLNLLKATSRCRNLESENAVLERSWSNRFTVGSKRAKAVDAFHEKPVLQVSSNLGENAQETSEDLGHLDAEEDALQRSL